MSTLKDKGNEHFKAGEYKEAEDLYTQAIQQRSSDPKLFSNRALTRIRLQNWRAAEADSRKAIELYGPENSASMKSHYYLAQALLALRHTAEALEEGKHAYKMCLDTKDSSSELLSQFILRAKQAHWQAKETSRIREMNSTLARIEDLLDQQLERDMADVEWRFSRGQIGETGRAEERTQLEQEAAEQRKITRDAFLRTQGNTESSERSVPDWLIDPITFEVMHDPVITPSGVSYERVSLLRHLQQSGLDPLTREPLVEKQLVPNVGLKNACAEFLDNNGWAVDW